VSRVASYHSEGVQRRATKLVHGIADLLLLSVGNVAIDLKGVVMGHLNMGTQQQTYTLDGWSRV